MQGLELLRYVSKPSSRSGFPLTPNVNNCRFANNGGIFNYSNGSFGKTYGTVSIVHMTVNFTGNTTFNANIGSALVIFSATIDIAENGNMSFTNCTGRIGGAILLTGESSVIFVHNSTQLIFHNNTATERGGAIYVDQAQEHYSGYSYSCFIRYSDPSVDPKKWKTSFFFSNNTEDGGTANSIFAHSILPCVWPSSINSTLEDDISETFCWNSRWHMKEAIAVIRFLLQPANFSNANGYIMELLPGRPQLLNVTVFDDLQHDVTNKTLFSASLHGMDTNVQYISNNNQITLGIKPNTFTKILVQTMDTRTIYTEINVTIHPCPPGFVHDETQKVCACGDGFDKSVVCHQANSIHP